MESRKLGLVFVLALVVFAVWQYPDPNASTAPQKKELGSSTTSQAPLPKSPAPDLAVETAPNKPVDFHDLPRVARKYRIIEAIKAEKLIDVIPEWERRAEQSPEDAYRLSHALFYCFMAYQSEQEIDAWAKSSERGYQKSGNYTPEYIASQIDKLRKDETRKYLYCRGLSKAQIDRYLYWQEQSASKGYVAAEIGMMHYRSPNYQKENERDWPRYCAASRALLERGNVTQVSMFALQLEHQCQDRNWDLERAALNLAVAQTAPPSKENERYRLEHLKKYDHLSEQDKQEIFRRAETLLNTWQRNGGAWDELIEIRSPEWAAEIRSQGSH